MNHPIEIWDEYLKDEQIREFRQPYHGKWRASMLGRCLRAQYWTRLHVAYSNELPIKTLRTFKFGDIIHQSIQQALPAEKCEQEFEFEDLVFHPDYIGDDTVYDFKSIRSFAFKLMQKDSFDITKSKPEHCLQVMTEAVYLNKMYGELIYICKDSSETNYDIDKRFRFKAEDWVARVNEELLMLRECWEPIRKQPPAMPRVYNGKECQYCSFKGLCDDTELFLKEGSV